MQKFIITSNGDFRYGDVRMHKDLLWPSDHCLGGGYYEFDTVGNRLLLHGASYDYGEPQWSRIEKLILPVELRGMEVYYEGERLIIP